MPAAARDADAKDGLQPSHNNNENDNDDNNNNHHHQTNMYKHNNHSNTNNANDIYLYMYVRIPTPKTTLQTSCRAHLLHAPCAASRLWRAYGQSPYKHCGFQCV